MSDLRSKLIRLAHENPELRSDLLPLLNRTAREGDIDDRLYDWAFKGVTLLTEFQRENPARSLHRDDQALLKRLKEDLLDLTDLVSGK